MLGTIRRRPFFARTFVLRAAFAMALLSACGDDSTPSPACDDGCLQPPSPVCDGDTLVSFGALGECLQGSCVYPESSRRVCEDGCTDGACTAAPALCTDVVCDAVPAPRCDGESQVRYDGGACDPSTGECAYTERRRDCEALGDVCREGRCVTPGLCETVFCDAPPDDFCRGRTTAVQHADDGTCSPEDGSCSYAPQTVDCATTGQICNNGRCVDAPPCGGERCDALPEPRCEETVAVTWANGRCDDATDVCVRDELRTDCTPLGQVCLRGACVDDPLCVGVACESPPSAFCDGSRVVRFEVPGTCSGGACTYDRAIEACSLMGMGCQDAQCVDASCLGVVCASPPSPSCDGTTALVPAGLGICELGACDYPRTPVDCAATDQVCRAGRCVSPPPCVAGECGDAPVAYCDGNLAKRPFGTGLCTDLGCVFSEETTNCDLLGQTCRDGVCRDACWEVSCDTPPSAACEGDTLLEFNPSGTCVAATGTCRYTPRATNCASTGEICLAGACAPDPCTPTTCATPPSAYCDGNTEVEPFGAGLCARGECTHSERRRDCAVDGLVCREGACRDACWGITCDAPPASFCELDIRVSFATAGTCNPATGGCRYTELYANCTDDGQVCIDGACVADPCDTIDCGAPPPSTCDGTTEVEFIGAAVCERGVCSWAERRLDCAADGRICAEGACRDACFGVTCDAPPAPTCDGDVLLTSSSTGTCALPSGECRYGITPRNCAATGELCIDGACVPDPCIAAPCGEAPAPLCDGTTSITRIGDAVCNRGVCTWTEIRRNCTSEGLLCVDGTCRDACWGVDCSDPPPASCDGDTRLGRADGVCLLPDGTCSWTIVPEDCLAGGSVCIDGACVTDPCPGIDCGTAPVDRCDGEIRVRYVDEAECRRGVCTWPEDVLDCASIGMRCDGGECVSLCTGVVCDSPPDEARCDGDTRIGPESPGVCDNLTGDCVYPDVALNCADAGQLCIGGTCVADPCSTVSCDVAPGSFCDGDTEVEPFGTGTCLRGVCSFAERRRDCLADGLACVDGACRDACYGIACDAPPAATCEDQTRVAYAAAGSCDPATATCTYAAVVTDCEARGEVCVDGACVPDPCDPGACAAVVPAAFCEGNTEVESLAGGVCEAGICVRPERRRDCTPDGLTCILGACRDGCFGVECGATPPAYCDDETRIVPVGAGICDPSDSSCSWALTAEDCTSSGQICVNGACVTNPCAGVSCAAPSDSAVCEGDNAVALISPGVCVRETGTCVFETVATPCAESGLLCREGACVDRCTDVTCGPAPGPACDGRTRLVFSGTGTCQAIDGSCSWPTEAFDCGQIGQRCDAGACVDDPCFGVSCNELPSPICQGDVLRSPRFGQCTLAAGGCVYEEVLIDCSASGQTCLDGVCQGVCFGVTCETAPADDCVGDVRVTRASPGVCADGLCRYEDIFENCLADGRICRAGQCIVPDPCDVQPCDTPPDSFCEGNRRVSFSADGTCDNSVCVFPRSEVDCTATGTFCVGGQCIASDPCTSFDCSEAPPGFCRGNEAVSLDFAGTCNLAGCIWEEIVETCGPESECVDGSCRDLCDGIACTTPPAPICRGNIANQFTTPATCAAGGCVWTTTETDCAASGQFCANGTCTSSDPCIGVTCATPPPAECAGTIRITYPSGVCEAGACVWTSATTDCAATGEACVGGACVPDACTGVNCVTPPAPVCLSATVARASSLPATCFNGVCSYTDLIDDCAAFGGLCIDGACQSIPNCGGTACAGPPAPFCDFATNTAIRSGAFAGCNGTNCLWQQELDPCDEEGGFCVDGACASVDPCAGVVCASPPADFCSANRTVNWNPTGICLGGACEYTFTSVICESTGEFCNLGVCGSNNPCAGITCDGPTPPVCNGTLLVTSTAGTCSSGICESFPVTTDCADAGLVCIAGACVEPSTCADTGCPPPPADTCSNDRLLTQYETSGLCTTGGCVYSSASVDCFEFGQVCARGRCGEPADRILRGDLLISEFLPGTAGWVEIRNVSTRAHDLLGLNLNTERASFRVTASVVIPAGGYAVIGSATSGIPGGPDATWGAGFSLDTSAGDIQIVNGFGLLDEVVYGSNWPFTASASAQLDVDTLDIDDNDVRTNWCVSTTEYAPGRFGTPGGANFACE